MSTIRLLVADDHPVVREGIEAILQLADDITVIGMAKDSAEAIALATSLHPDVLLLDLEMPGGGGAFVASALASAASEVRVLVFTAHDDDASILDAARAGIHGYLLKGSARAELFDAIRRVHAKETVLPPAITQKLLARVGSTDPSEQHVELTPREQEVLACVATGLTNREVGEALSISERTVKFHVSSLFRKLDVENRTELTSRALQLKLVDL